MDRDRRHTHSVTLPGEQIVTYSPQESAYLESNIGVSGHHNNSNNDNNNNKHVPPPPPPPGQNIFPVGYIQPQHLISLQERVCFEQFPFNGIFNSSFWQIIIFIPNYRACREVTRARVCQNTSRSRAPAPCLCRSTWHTCLDTWVLTGTSPHRGDRWRADRSGVSRWTGE